MQLGLSAQRSVSETVCILSAQRSVSAAVCSATPNNMIYTFLSSVFIALFLVVGTVAFMLFLENCTKPLPFSWICYQHVIVLAIIAALCFICACVFGAQIPDCYARI